MLILPQKIGWLKKKTPWLHGVTYHFWIRFLNYSSPAKSFDPTFEETRQSDLILRSHAFLDLRGTGTVGKQTGTVVEEAWEDRIT